MKKELLFLIFLLATIASCCEKNVDVSDYLRREAHNSDICYDDILEKCYKKDSSSIVKIATIKFHNSAISENGSHIIGIVDKIGEAEFIKIIHNCTDEQKQTIYFTILSGFDFISNPKYMHKKFIEVFPSLYLELSHWS